MAINLNPGADATLVNAAYRAAVSSAPGDYSRTLQRAADSYEKTMQAQSQTFGTIAKLGASIGVEMMANAQKNIDQLAKGDTLNPEDTEFFVNKLQTVKNELSELGPLKGMFGNKQTRIDRAKLKAKQKGIFASIDQALLNIKTGNEIVASGAFDDTLLNEKLDEKETINAIIKSNQKNKFTKNGNEAKLSENENGDLMYTLYNNNGGLSVNPNGSNEPVTMTLEKFNELIANNVKDGGAMKGALNKISNATYKSGITSLSGTYDPEMKQMHLNALDSIINNETDLRRGMGTKFGDSNSSFLEDIKKPSNLSMWVYNDLLAATSAEGGVLAEGGILEGVKDIDGEPGISQKDLQNTDNYGVLAANIIGMKDQDVTKALFKEYTIDKFEATHKYGYSKKPPVAGKTDGTDADGNDNIDFYKNKVQKLNGANWNSGNATSVYNDIKAGFGFRAKDPATKEVNDYSYHVVNEKGGWYQNYMVGDNETTTESYIGPNGGDVGKIFTNDPRFKNIETSVTVEEDVEGNVTNSREINIKTKTKKKYGAFKKGTQSISLENILSSLQSFDPDQTLIQYQALLKFQEKTKNETNDNRYKLVEHINSFNNTNIGVDQLDAMINDLVVDTDPLNNN